MTPAAVLLLNGGSLDNVMGVVGASAGSTGEVTLKGLDAAWANSATLTVGAGGTGTLTILEGNTVSSTDGIVGMAVGAVGTVVVDGKLGLVSSNWTNSGNLTVGESGTGTLLVTNGGMVFNVDASLGVNAGSTGTATVDGAGSTWTSTGDLYVGDAGHGTLTVSNGGTVVSDGVHIAGAAGSVGHVMVTGAGSSLTGVTGIKVGESGTGTLAISAGGQLTSNGGMVGFSSGWQWHGHRRRRRLGMGQQFGYRRGLLGHGQPGDHQRRHGHRGYRLSGL